MANIICENCNGRGSIPTDAMETCGECGGTGEKEKAWSFHLLEMEIVESVKGEDETVVRFRSRGSAAEGIEVILKINFPWPMEARQGPPGVGSVYAIDFLSPSDN